MPDNRQFYWVNQALVDWCIYSVKVTKRQFTLKQEKNSLLGTVVVCPEYKKISCPVWSSSNTTSIVPTSDDILHQLVTCMAAIQIDLIWIQEIASDNSSQILKVVFISRGWPFQHKAGLIINSTHRTLKQTWSFFSLTIILGPGYKECDIHLMLGLKIQLVLFFQGTRH